MTRLLLDDGDMMTAREFHRARIRLGKMWYGRPLRLSEMARACRLGGAKPSDTIRNYERGKTMVSGPLSALVECYLSGCEPPDGVENIRDWSDAPDDEDDDEGEP